MSVYLDRLKEAGGLNDRLNLVLLKYKARKNLCDKVKLKRLQRFYPDCGVFEEGAREFLEERGLIKLVNGGLTQNSKGNFEHGNGLPEYWQTTEAGEAALKSSLFPSEKAEQTGKFRFRLFQVIGICIAAIGGLITIVAFFNKLFKGLLQ